jgi:hypothetical protein
MSTTRCTQHDEVAPVVLHFANSLPRAAHEQGVAELERQLAIDDRLAAPPHGQELHREALGDLPQGHPPPEVLRARRGHDLGQPDLLGHELLRRVGRWQQAEAELVHEPVDDLVRRAHDEDVVFAQDHVRRDLAPLDLQHGRAVVRA